MRRRLDAEMVRRGVAASRAEAQQAIRAGKVTVAGRPVAKSGTLVLPEEPIAMAAATRRFVSRGGEKLEAALDRFDVEVGGRTVLDAGASTGGFTDCLLSRGADRVFAVDVGYGQLHWRLRQDPRVTVIERTNVRDLDPASLPAPPDMVTADLSFISLRLVMPALVRSSLPEAEFVVLVKPQFEAGRSEVHEGVVRDPSTWRAVLRSVGRAVREGGLRLQGLMASPLLGPAGNVEFFLHARRAAITEEYDGTSSDESFPDRVVDGAIAEANRLVARLG